MFILNFHGIGRSRWELPPSERKVWIDKPHFETILDFLVDRNDVRITFDDSNESDYSIALPALLVRGMSAQFFAVASRIGQPGYLSLSHIEAIVAAGMMVGNHGMRHRPWMGLSAEELHEELIQARNRLEEITGMPIHDAACPFGSYNRRVIQQLKRSGYTRIYTSDGGPILANALILPRNSVRRSDNLSTISQTLSDTPDSLRKLWRQMKLLLKRLR